MAVEVSWRKLPRYWGVYLLIAIPLGLVALFNYQVIASGVWHAFFRWDGDLVTEFVGWANFTRMIQDANLPQSFLVVAIFIVCNLIKMILPIATALVLHHIVSDRWGYCYRVLFVVPMIIPSMVAVLMWKYFYEPNSGVLNGILRFAGVVEPTGSVQFLSDSYLALPSLIFMGFPWVGAFGVLIYLAGLQSISKDIYEAAEIDGAGVWQVLWRIELPLITTQIRINLILMVIDTVQSWENVYLFLGEDGGPGGVATVPGLLIFREAFSRGLFGYGCAIGFVIFVVTMFLTLINNKFVRVRK